MLFFMWMNVAFCMFFNQVFRGCKSFFKTTLMNKFSFTTEDVQGTANRQAAIGQASKYSNMQNPDCPFIVNKDAESAHFNSSIP